MLVSEERFHDFSMRNGLKRIALKLGNVPEAKIAFIGGSVTDGGGSSDRERTSCRALTCRYLECRFPETAFTFVNAAIGGTDSTYGAYRLEDHIPNLAEVDLLFIEFAVNDAGNRTASIRAMEGIVRHAKRKNPHIDICFLYTANQSGSESFTENARLQENIYNHEEVAEYYQLPSVNIARAIYSKIVSGTLQWKDVSEDTVHPNDFGYALYAQFLEVFLEEALCAANAESEDPLGLPPPIDPFCYANGKQLSPLEAEGASGWQEIKGWTTEKTCNWTPPADIYMAEKPGSEWMFRFTGTAVGISMLGGMDTGDVEVSIDGEPFRHISLFDRYCPAFYRPKLVLFADQLERGTHTIKVRISRDRHEQSGGNAVHILKLLVNG